MIRLLLQPMNLLILDEPTNHLDMKTKDILKQAIKDFDGTVIVVSHDREFLDGLVEKVYEFGGGQVKECLGGIYEFLEKKKIASLHELELSKSTGTAPADKGGNSTKTNSHPNPDKAASDAEKTSTPRLSYAEQREREKMLRKAAKKVADAELKISELETEIATIENRIAAGEVDGDIFTQHQTKTRDLETAMSLWELASQEHDDLKARFGK